MADITMCKGINCNQTNTCYRYLAKANPYLQSYFSDSPMKDGKCDEYVRLLGAMEWNGEATEC